MFTYNNVLGNFISYASDISDLDSDSNSEFEFNNDDENIDERTQLVESLLCKYFLLK